MRRATLAPFARARGHLLSTARVGVLADRAWNVNINGLAHANIDGNPYASGETGSFFGVVNLLAPRASGSFNYWSNLTTFVQVRYTFVRHTPNLDGPDIMLDRTFITF